VRNRIYAQTYVCESTVYGQVYEWASASECVFVCVSVCVSVCVCFFSLFLDLRQGNSHVNSVQKLER
jgi:hypothetical protein